MKDNGGIRIKSFRGKSGGAEHFMVIGTDGRGALADQIAQIEERYAEAQKTLGLAPETAIFRRIFLSDAINQAPVVRQTGLMGDPRKNPVAVSIVQQPPLPGSKIGLLAYHIESAGPLKKRRLKSTRSSDSHVLVEKNNIRHLWSTCLCAGAHAATSPVEVQTHEAFKDLIESLTSQKANLRDHCVRTWIFMKNVDAFYRGMVNARYEVFAKEGLGSKTHTIASTGIEGACEHQFDLMSMDAYSVPDLKPGQMTYLNDYSRLSRTEVYNVNFERGTRVAWADRALHIISGTASIDGTGKTMYYDGDVMRQAERMFGNVDALLRAGSATIDDMMHMIVYLRDPADHARIDAYMNERFASIPYIIVEGAVCRPDWLIEVEGMAIAANDEPDLPVF
ncbi:MAG: Rid family hydrolase [Alphaproteobacteria bacterium]|nr:Rid family hydrolase [Alphaproteobacteria bacterium]